MDRNSFHKFFKSPGPVVLPVIHVRDAAQTEHNIRIAIDEGAAGVFLINHDFGIPEFLPIIRSMRDMFPCLWLGLNFLAVTGKDAFPVLKKLQRDGIMIDGYWADDARIDEMRDIADQPEAQGICDSKGTWKGFYTGGTCFKKQREVEPEHFEQAARIAARYMDAVCTSGVATGKAIDLEKIAKFRKGLGDTALTLASGITPENAGQYALEVDGFMVATGIAKDGDFYNIDPQRLRQLLSITRKFGATA
jgi:hypothetical protein